ncbi:MAG: hypothetical protein HY779_05290, partial [Rubrobacteridae bacterium]|nr:hypothetical protein [Rubrobacteridae bacterium]
MGNTIYEATHRFIVKHNKRSKFWIMDEVRISDPGKKMLYPFIALFIGFQLIIYQLVVFAYPAFENNNQAAAPSPHEILEKRTFNSKHYRNPDGSMTATLYSTPIHYKDSKGEWEEIDTDIGADREIDSAPYKASFDDIPAYHINYKGISASLALKTENSVLPVNSDVPENYENDDSKSLNNPGSVDPATTKSEPPETNNNASNEANTNINENET